ncbi:MAG TPA: endonuclease/exonuclease/phosphatase family protein [Anaerolineae bacterium]|jgi:endonuclease/exonuclease/phosphatase family metal-dependent hydrolase|nr:endonuclease/exonuclease/phosphatase family protein [Anaerolineae bacterium]
MRLSESRSGPAVLVYAVLFLFFLQLLTDFVAGIYGYGVLGTGIPLEMAALVLFLIPFALLFFRRGLPVSALIVLGQLVLLCRVVEVWLPLRWQLLVAGLGTSLFLVLFPALLWDRGQKGDRRTGPLMAAGLLLAVALSVLLRTLGATMDLSNEGWFRIIALLLAAATAVPLPSVFRAAPPQREPDETGPGPIGRGKSLVLSLGIICVFLLLFFAFTGPAVVARWTGDSHELVLFLAVLALALFAWLWTASRRALGGLSRNWLLILTALFVLVMSLTLAVHQVPLPRDPAGFPLLDPQVSAGWILALLAMLLLYPVLFLDFGLLVEETILGRPSMPALGLAFGLGSLFALIMILGNVFTSTWSYIDPVLEPVVRGRFWQVHLLIGLVLTLTLLAVGGKTVTAAAGVRIHRALAGLVTAAGLLTLLAMFLSAPDTDAVQPSGGLRVAGYNIQQGYDILEQRGHEAQCEVLKEIDADIVALSETDTTRIAGANFDIVRYLAQCLDMYSHAGPKTGIATFGYAILSKYPIENPEVYHFFSGANQPSSANPGSTSGGDQAAVIKAQITVDGETYNFFSNHFDGNPPIEQAQAHAKLTAGLDKVISIGDYNCRPGSPCVDEIETVLVNCADLTGDGELAADRVDHIFLSPDLTCSEFVYIQRDASDHPAVAAEIGR